LHKRAGWSVGNCLNWDEADKSDKDRYAENPLFGVVSRPHQVRSKASPCILKYTIKAGAFIPSVDGQVLARRSLETTPNRDYTQLKNTISNKAKEDFYFANYLNFVHNINGFSLK
jgi:hypothetical protein